MNSESLVLNPVLSEVVLQRQSIQMRSLGKTSVVQPVRCGWNSCAAKLQNGEICPCQEFGGGMSASLCKNCGHSYSDHY